MQIQFLRAFNGDAILLNFEDEGGKVRNILIDGGTQNTYIQRGKNRRTTTTGDLKLLTQKLRDQNQKIDLLILTHVDDDHIGGILCWLEKDQHAAELIDRVWFNSGNLIAECLKENPPTGHTLDLHRLIGKLTSIRQGIEFEKFINDKKIWDRQVIKALDRFDIYGIEITILSPDKEKLKSLLTKWELESVDRSTSRRRNDYNLSLNELLANDQFVEDDKVHNGSSIAFILTYKSLNFLFLGDAHPSCVATSLRKLKHSNQNPLKIELMKISHHGSKGNTNNELLGLLECSKFVVSSNGAIHSLPDKRCLARIINSTSDSKIYFNYPEIISRIFTQQDFDDFDFEALATDNPFLF